MINRFITYRWVTPVRDVKNEVVERVSMRYPIDATDRDVEVVSALRHVPDEPQVRHVVILSALCFAIHMYDDPVSRVVRAFAFPRSALPRSVALTRMAIGHESLYSLQEVPWGRLQWTRRWQCDDDAEGRTARSPLRPFAFRR